MVLEQQVFLCLSSSGHSITLRLSLVYVKPGLHAVYVSNSCVCTIYRGPFHFFDRSINPLASFASINYEQALCSPARVFCRLEAGLVELACPTQRDLVGPFLNAVGIWAVGDSLRRHLRFSCTQGGIDRSLSKDRVLSLSPAWPSLCALPTLQCRWTAGCKVLFGCAWYCFAMWTVGKCVLWLTFHCRVEHRKAI